MTTDQQDYNIGNATEIIERFGGIRPMSAKTGVAVTTIQGWKQRNSIPAARRADLVEAAKNHGIDLGNLLEASTSPEEKPEQEPETETVREKEIRIGQTTARDATPSLPPVRMQSQKTTLLIAAILIIAAAVIGVVLALAPKVSKMTDQERKIHELELEIQAMKDRKAGNALIPEEYQRSLSQLQSKVGQLATEAQNYKGVVDTLQHDLANGTMQERMAKIEGQVQTIVAHAKASGLQDMVMRVRMLQSSPQGIAQLGDIVSSLLPAVQLPEGTTDETFTAAMQQLKQTDPKVAEAFKDVAPEDMKAAVMLVGMAQLRASLERDNASFDTDLALLKATMAKDDPDLSNAIDRLAPNAKAGVLTPDGLSKEFRSLAGDVVAASLSGESVSIEDKALARFGNLVKVEKDGQQISGTETQIRVAEAQKRLDQGDVEGAIGILQQIEGPAAEKTQPFINQAQATVMARQLQQTLGTNLLMKLKMMGSGLGGGAPYIVHSNGIGSLVPDIPEGGAH